MQTLRQNWDSKDPSALIYIKTQCRAHWEVVGQSGQQHKADEAVERTQLALLGVHQPQRQLRQRERDEAPRLAPQSSDLRPWYGCSYA